ncbi:LAQU0S09e00232g1_1 [Lachancea quebecensis]|uniref:LAQU0S09e00232g1_1 n=1 Tax=Lachancea quebecensis TaxID=1654605 RepID=A0A0P1L068_9SACH|nr:LAQU0S09e00232g1_1 [Lachancea quebecensis]
MLFGTRDIIVEHQRGAMVLGYPVFSPNLLIRGVDPPQFQLVGEDGHTVEEGEIKAGGGMYPFDLRSPLKGFKWYVSMDHGNRYDTDDQGWCYSWRFRGRRWKAHGGFVRKRFWVRLPVKGREMTPAEPEICDSSTRGASDVRLDGPVSGSIDETAGSLAGPVVAVRSRCEEQREKLLEELHKPSLDRQKADLALHYIAKLPEEERRQAMRPDSELMEQVLCAFQFKESRLKFLQVQVPALLNSVSG